MWLESCELQHLLLLHVTMLLQVHQVRSQMVKVLEDKFGYLSLTFSIGGQISFDVQK